MPETIHGHPLSVDLDRASAERLATRIDSSLAHALVATRDALGGFGSFAELMQVPGMTPLSARLLRAFGTLAQEATPRVFLTYGAELLELDGYTGHVARVRTAPEPLTDLAVGWRSVWASSATGVYRYHRVHAHEPPAFVDLAAHGVTAFTLAARWGQRLVLRTVTPKGLGYAFVEESGEVAGPYGLSRYSDLPEAPAPRTARAVVARNGDVWFLVQKKGAPTLLRVRGSRVGEALTLPETDGAQGLVEGGDKGPPVVLCARGGAPFAYLPADERFVALPPGTTLVAKGSRPGVLLCSARSWVQEVGLAAGGQTLVLAAPGGDVAWAEWLVPGGPLVIGRAAPSGERLSFFDPGEGLERSTLTHTASRVATGGWGPFPRETVRVRVHNPGNWQVEVTLAAHHGSGVPAATPTSQYVDDHSDFVFPLGELAQATGPLHVALRCEEASVKGTLEIVDDETGELRKEPLRKPAKSASVSVDGWVGVVNPLETPSVVRCERGGRQWSRVVPPEGQALFEAWRGRKKLTLESELPFVCTGGSKTVRARELRGAATVWLPGPRDDRRLDPNTATAADLAQVPLIGSLAEAITADRRKRGPFASIEDLVRVQGVQAADLARLGGWLVVRRQSYQDPTTVPDYGDPPVDPVDPTDPGDFEPQLEPPAPVPTPAPPASAGPDRPRAPWGGGLLRRRAESSGVPFVADPAGTERLLVAGDLLEGHSGDYRLREVDLVVCTRGLSLEVARLWTARQAAHSWLQRVTLGGALSPASPLPSGGLPPGWAFDLPALAFSGASALLHLGGGLVVSVVLDASETRFPDEDVTFVCAEEEPSPGRKTSYRLDFGERTFYLDARGLPVRLADRKNQAAIDLAWDTDGQTLLHIAPLVGLPVRLAHFADRLELHRRDELHTTYTFEAWEEGAVLRAVTGPDGRGPAYAYQPFRVAVAGPDATLPLFAPLLQAITGEGGGITHLELEDASTPGGLGDPQGEDLLLTCVPRVTRRRRESAAHHAPSERGDFDGVPGRVTLLDERVRYFTDGLGDPGFQRTCAEAVERRTYRLLLPDNRLVPRTYGVWDAAQDVTNPSKSLVFELHTVLEPKRTSRVSSLWRGGIWLLRAHLVEWSDSPQRPELIRVFDGKNRLRREVRQRWLGPVLVSRTGAVVPNESWELGDPALDPGGWGRPTRRRLETAEGPVDAEQYAWWEDGRLRRVSTPDARAEQYGWGSGADGLSIFLEQHDLVASDGQKRSTLHAYDDEGRLTRITHPDGTVARIERSRAGRIRRVSLSDAAERLLSERVYDWRDAESAVDVTVTMGPCVRVVFDGFGGELGRVSFPTKEKDLSRAHVTWQWSDDAGRKTKWLATGRELAEQDYDALGRPLALRIGGQRVAAWRYDDTLRSWRLGPGKDDEALGTLRVTYVGAADQPPGLLDRHEEVYDVFDQGVASRSFTPRPGQEELLQQVTTVYHANGLVAREVRDTEVTEYEYDPEGRLKKVTAAGGATLEYAYHGNGMLHELLDSTLPDKSAGRAAASARFELDVWGEVTDGYDAVDSHTLWRRDERGRVVGVVWPDGSEETYAIDGTARVQRWRHGNQTRTIRREPSSQPGVSWVRTEEDGLGRVYRSEHDGFGDALCVRDPLGDETRIERDAAGRLRRLKDPLGAEWTWEWDDVARVTGPGGVTAELRGAPLTGVTSYSLPDSSQVSQQRDAANRPAGYSLPLDERGSLLRPGQAPLDPPSGPMRGALSVQYREDGTLERVEDADGVGVGVRRLGSAQRHFDAHVSFLLDGHSPTELKTNARGNVEWLRRSDGVELTLDWDNVDRLTRVRVGADLYLFQWRGQELASVTGPRVRWTSTWSYDAAGPAVHTIDADGLAKQVTTFDENGLPVRRDFQNVEGLSRLEWGWDPLGRVERFRVNEAVEFELAYARDERTVTVSHGNTGAYRKLTVDEYGRVRREERGLAADDPILTCEVSPVLSEGRIEVTERAVSSARAGSLPTLPLREHVFLARRDGALVGLRADANMRRREVALEPTPAGRQGAVRLPDGRMWRVVRGLTPGGPTLSWLGPAAVPIVTAAPTAERGSRAPLPPEEEVKERHDFDSAGRLTTVARGAGAGDALDGPGVVRFAVRGGDARVTEISAGGRSPETQLTVSRDPAQGSVRHACFGSEVTTSFDGIGRCTAIQESLPTRSRKTEVDYGLDGTVRMLHFELHGNRQTLKFDYDGRGLRKVHGLGGLAALIRWNESPRTRTLELTGGTTLDLVAAETRVYEAEMGRPWTREGGRAGVLVLHRCSLQPKGGKEEPPVHPALAELLLPPLALEYVYGATFLPEPWNPANCEVFGYHPILRDAPLPGQSTGLPYDWTQQGTEARKMSQFRVDFLGRLEFVGGFDEGGVFQASRRQSYDDVGNVGTYKLGARAPDQVIESLFDGTKDVPIERDAHGLPKQLASGEIVEHDAFGLIRRVGDVVFERTPMGGVHAIRSADDSAPPLWALPGMKPIRSMSVLDGPYGLVALEWVHADQDGKETPMSLCAVPNFEGGHALLAWSIGSGAGPGGGDEWQGYIPITLPNGELLLMDADGFVHDARFERVVNGEFESMMGKPYWVEQRDAAGKFIRHRHTPFLPPIRLLRRVMAVCASSRLSVGGNLTGPVPPGPTPTVQAQALYTAVGWDVSPDALHASSMNLGALDVWGEIDWNRRRNQPVGPAVEDFGLADALKTVGMALLLPVALTAVAVSSTVLAPVATGAGLILAAVGALHDHAQRNLEHVERTGQPRSWFAGAGTVLVDMTVGDTLSAMLGEDWSNGRPLGTNERLTQGVVSLLSLGQARFSGFVARPVTRWTHGTLLATTTTFPLSTALTVAEEATRHAGGGAGGRQLMATRPTSGSWWASKSWALTDWAMNPARRAARISRVTSDSGAAEALENMSYRWFMLTADKRVKDPGLRRLLVVSDVFGERYNRASLAHAAHQDIGLARFNNRFLPRRSWLLLPVWVADQGVAIRALAGNMAAKVWDHLHPAKWRRLGETASPWSPDDKKFRNDGDFYVCFPERIPGAMDPVDVREIRADGSPGSVVARGPRWRHELAERINAKVGVTIVDTHPQHGMLAPSFPEAAGKVGFAEFEYLRDGLPFNKPSKNVFNATREAMPYTLRLAPTNPWYLRASPFLTGAYSAATRVAREDPNPAEWARPIVGDVVHTHPPTDAEEAEGYGALELPHQRGKPAHWDASNW